MTLSATEDAFPAPSESSNVSTTNGTPFCSKPFEHGEITPGGDLFCCCPDWLPTPLGNLHEQTLNSAWNSTVAQDIRHSILDGSYKYCDAAKCPLLASKTLPPADSVLNERMRSVIDNKLTELPYSPVVLNLCYDRSCNLSCPSCRPKIIMAKGEEHQKNLKLQTELLDSGLSDTEMLIVTGSGDPFGSYLYRELLTSLDSSAYPRLTVKLMTNGQLFTPAAWNYWHKLHSSIRVVAISIDAATDATYRIVRRGGELKTLLENLDFVSQLRRNSQLDCLEISFVVQQLNYREIPSFIRLGKSYGVDIISFAHISDWGTYGPEAFVQQCVHDPSHPQHQEYLDILADPILRDPVVFPGNMSLLMPKL